MKWHKTQRDKICNEKWEQKRYAQDAEKKRVDSMVLTVIKYIFVRSIDMIYNGCLLKVFNEVRKKLLSFTFKEMDSEGLRDLST